MSWKPTEGMRRADAVVDQYAKDMEQAVAFCVPQIMRSRLFDLVAVALDQALADGAEQDAINAVVKGNGSGETHDAGSASFSAYAWGQAVQPVPPTADPVGLDMPDFPAGPTIVVGDGKVVGPAGVTATIAEQMEHIDKTEPKKRGRPKGSTNKAKKKAKAAKKAAQPDVEVPASAPVDPTAS